MKFERLLDEISVKMRLLKLAQETKSTERYSEREILLLELIDANNKMSISEITENFKVVSKSIISSTISNFWKTKLVNKDKDFANQRITYVSLTPEGKKLLSEIREQQAERFSVLIDALGLTPEETKMMERILENAIKMFDFKK